MIKNCMIELATFTKEPSQIGAKLRQNALDDTIADEAEDPRYDQVRQKIKKLDQSVQVLQQAKKEYFKTSRPEKQKQIYDTINTNISEANKAMKELKPLIQDINQDFKTESEQGDRSRLVECNRVTVEANEAIKRLKEVQKQITEQIKNTLQRQATMIKGEDVSQKQLEDMIHQPQMGQQMLREQLLESPSLQLENAVSDIIDKCNQVVRLQRNMRECLRMMEDLTELVNYQGERLLTIEQALDGAHDHMSKGEKKLEKGKEYHKKSQKKMCCIMFILLLIIGVIVIPIVITKL